MKNTEYKDIQRFIDEKIAPGILAHGGDIHIVSYENHILKVALSGACDGCSVQAYTSEAISNYILEEFPDLDDVLVTEADTEDSYLLEKERDMQKTLSIIKPDGVRRNLVGLILARMEADQLQISALKMVHLTPEQAQAFYEVHKERPFYEELWKSMCAAPVVVSVLSGENAVTRYRELMGATDPAKAMAGSIRAEFGLSVGENTVHGSDSLENAQTEVSFFFPECA